MVRARVNEGLKLPRVAAVALWLAGWSLLVAQTCPPPGGTYIYDENGRLAAVVNPSAAQPNARLYNYDAAGNITSIASQDSSQVSVISFTPPCGSAATATSPGTTVTIYGTGFSTTPSQNTVTFTGAGGVTPTSPTTATKLVVTVPMGAVTGPIGVTAPGGTASSARQFRVDGCGAPTITDVTTCPGQGCFTARIGTPGTSVTITGTNFDPSVINNRAAIGVRSAAVTAASPAGTSLTAVVPVGGGGPVSVSTSGGTAVGPDFFIVPTGFTASEVDDKTRMSFPGTGSVTITTAGHVALVLFDVPPGGHRVRRTVLPPASSSLVGPRLYGPDGAEETLQSEDLIGSSWEATDPLPPGTHTLLVQTLPNQTGTFPITLEDIVDLQLWTTLNAAPIPITLAPFQNVYLSFPGTTSYQAVTLQVTVFVRPAPLPPLCVYASVGDAVPQQVCSDRFTTVVENISATLVGAPQVHTAVTDQRVYDDGGSIQLRVTSP